MKCYLRKHELELIVQQLRKYPFIEKMSLCQENSTRLMKATHLDILNTPNAAYPWELEVFAELSLFADAPNATHSFKDSDTSFVNIINKIRNYQHPFIEQQKDMDFANALIMALGLQQFKQQENIIDRLYRYDYFWNFINESIDMQKIFSDTFKDLTYTEFRNLCLLIYFYASIENTQQIIQALMVKYENVIMHLKITREEYQKKQSEKIDDNFENVIFGFNYLRPYPFVEFNGFVFLPLPYLIVESVTESLLTRVTNGNNSIREKIGKEVAQSYIEKILKECEVYDEVLPECEYHKGKQRFDSPDVLIKKGEQVCFIDTKLSTPKLDIRKFNTKVIDDTVLQYAKNTIQVYNRIKDFCDSYYYPFKEKILIDKNDVFGLVVVFEDSYITRRKIYREVFNKLQINDDSDEAKYIKAHIKVTNFRDIELFAFKSLDIFLALTHKRDDSACWNDFPVYDASLYEKGAHKISMPYDEFIEKCKAVWTDSIEEFKNMGIIN